MSIYDTVLRSSLKCGLNVKLIWAPSLMHSINKPRGLLKDHVIKDGDYEDLFYFGIINPHENHED